MWAPKSEDEGGMDNRHILDGLGEMLAEPKKDWTRAKLRTDLCNVVSYK